MAPAAVLPWRPAHCAAPDVCRYPGWLPCNAALPCTHPAPQCTGCARGRAPSPAWPPSRCAWVGWGASLLGMRDATSDCPVLLSRAGRAAPAPAPAAHAPCIFCCAPGHRWWARSLRRPTSTSGWRCPPACRPRWRPWFGAARTGTRSAAPPPPRWPAACRRSSCSCARRRQAHRSRRRCCAAELCPRAAAAGCCGRGASKI